MTPVQETDEVVPGIHIWHAYDAGVKAELFSTSLQTEAAVFLVDPIPLGSNILERLLGRSQLAGVFVTNENHVRSTRTLAATFRLPVFLHRQLHGIDEFSDTRGLNDGEKFSPGLTAVAIDGAPRGEMALHYEAAGGTMVLGDALINFEPHGFGFLPAKYCVDAKQMRRSLRKLLDYPFERMLFAHGSPILSKARARVEMLLAESR